MDSIQDEADQPTTEKKKAGRLRKVPNAARTIKNLTNWK
jgi:hypothetical protein